MPAQHRGRCDEQPEAPLGGQQSSEGYNHGSVRPTHSRSWPVSLKYCELVAEHQDLDLLRGVRSGEQDDPSQDSDHDEVCQSHRHRHTMPGYRLRTNRQVSGREPRFGHPQVAPDGRRVYLANHESDTVSVIDTVLNRVIVTIPVGNAPHCVAITTDGHLAYTANSDINSVSIIDTQSDAVRRTIPTGDDADDIAITGDGRHASITDLGSNTVSMIDTRSGAVAATIPVGNDPRGVALTADDRYAYITNLGSNTVSLIGISEG